MRNFILIFSAVLLFSTGCDQNVSPIKYYTLDELDGLDKFRGYDICEDGKPTIEGPYRIVSGVNFTIKREAMVPLKRELDFNGKRWQFEHADSDGWSFRFLALGNPKGESCAIMLKSEEKVPHFLETAKGKESIERAKQFNAGRENGTSGDDDASDESGDATGDDKASAEKDAADKGSGDDTASDASATESDAGNEEGSGDKGTGDDGSGNDESKDGT